MIWLLLALALVVLLDWALWWVVWRFDRVFPPPPDPEIERARQALMLVVVRLTVEMQPFTRSLERMGAAFSEFGRKMEKVAPMLREAEADRRRMYRAARRRR